MAIRAPEALVTIRAADRDGATVVTELAGTEPWCPRSLGPAGRWARVALVQTRASLLGGDAVGLELDLAAGCAVELLELGATLAHHARGASPARLRTHVRLGAGARLVWLGEPLIAAAGCDVIRSTVVELDPGAAVLLGEALVLGRVGEAPGKVRAHTRIAQAGRPVVDETIDTDPPWLLRSSVAAGAGRMLSALTLAGMRDDDPPAGAMQAHAPATLWRHVGVARDPRRGAPAARWHRLLVDAG